jgi:hypothetical protein
MEEIKEHQLLAGQPLRGCDPEPIELTETTRATLMLFHERLTMDEKLHMSAQLMTSDPMVEWAWWRILGQSLRWPPLKHTWPPIRERVGW